MKTKSNPPGYNNLYLWKSKSNPKKLLLSCNVYPVDYSEGEAALMLVDEQGNIAPYEIKDQENYSAIKNTAEALAKKLVLSPECIGLRVNCRADNSYLVAYVTEARTFEIIYKKPGENSSLKSPEDDIQGRKLPAAYKEIFAPLTGKLMSILRANAQKAHTHEM